MVSGILKDRMDERNWKMGQHRKQVTRNLYRTLSEAESKGAPVAYIPIMNFQELFNAMGVLQCGPENMATILAAKQDAQRFCEAAEQRSISPNVCSYSRLGLGMMYLDDGPFGKPPPPTIIISTSLACDPHAKWWEIEAEYYKAPLFRFDGPFNFSGKLETYQLEWMVYEIKRLIRFVEEHTGVKFDYDRFKEAMILSGKALELFNEVHNYRKVIPCPRDLRETAGDFFYLAYLLGTQEAVDYFTMVRDDVKDRAENGVGIVPEERFRIYYDNIPIWYRLQLFDYLADRGAVIPIDRYTAWIVNGFHFDGGHFDPEKPFESYALRWLYHDLVLGREFHLKRTERAMEEWRCDAAIFTFNKSCRRLSSHSLYGAKVLREKHDIPSIFFEADMGDPRSLDEAEAHARMDALLELLEQRKG